MRKRDTSIVEGVYARLSRNALVLAILTGAPETGRRSDLSLHEQVW